MYLLDTNVISELRKAGNNKANHNVIVWAKGIPVSELFISAITILEIEMGILQLQRKDPEQASIFRVWLDQNIMVAFHNRILPIDHNVARKCAALHVPNPKSERDAMIAATALFYGHILVTRNEKDFCHIDVPLLNPWVQ